MKKISAFAMMICLVASLAVGGTGMSVTALAGHQNEVLPMADDMVVIPDAYNTGCRGQLYDFDSLTAQEKLTVTGGVEIIGGYNAKTDKYDDYRINLKHLLPNEEGYVIKDIDFSHSQFYFSNPGTEHFKIRFENCRFKNFRGSNEVHAELIDCSLESLTATNLLADGCQIGHSYNDGIRTFNDVIIQNCYMVDFQYPLFSTNPEVSQHIDGYQMFGNSYDKNKGETKGKDAGNVRFYNCRFEIPTYYIDVNNRASMNDCIMLQPEYSDAYHFSFENIITNGANYQFSAHRGQDKTQNNVVRDLGDVSLKNCRMGEGSIGGIMTAVDNFVKLENVGISTTLYVGSIWEDAEGTRHISVTNDSVNERILTIVTDKEVKSVTIPAYPLASVTNVKSEENKYKYNFSDYPIDMDIQVEASDYVVCYDTTYEPKQIRFVNDTDQPVWIDNAVLEPYCREVTIVSQGQCGKDAYYNLTSDGVLTVSGNGAMYNYHSKDLPPWDRKNMEDKVTPAAPKPYISQVVIEEGITHVGNQAFNHRGTIQKVQLPSTLETIGAIAFGGCASVQSIVLPASLKEVYDRAFENTFALKFTYLGDDFSQVKGGSSIAQKVIGTKEYEQLNDPSGSADPDEKDTEPKDDNNPDVTELDPGTAEPGQDDTKPDETKPILVQGSMRLRLAYDKTTYTGKAKKPSVRVLGMNGLKVEPQYYTVTYKNNRNVGTALVMVELNGAYTGKMQAEFDIVPAKTKVQKVATANKSMAVTVKKVKSQITGYEIQVSTDKKFKKQVKKITFSKKKALTRNIKGLKGNKKYYIRVRTYAKKQGKKYYSNWSTYKKKVAVKG